MKTSVNVCGIAVPPVATNNTQISAMQTHAM